MNNRARFTVYSKSNTNMASRNVINDLSNPPAPNTAELK